MRHHLETCVFSSLADELKSGDICVSGSEQFADYRDQLLSWSECEPKVAAYCQQLGLPATAEGFVQHLRTRLTEVGADVDRTRPENLDLMITRAKKLIAQAPEWTMAGARLEMLDPGAAPLERADRALVQSQAQL